MLTPKSILPGFVVFLPCSQFKGSKTRENWRLLSPISEFTSRRSEPRFLVGLQSNNKRVQNIYFDEKTIVIDCLFFLSPLFLFLSSPK